MHFTFAPTKPYTIQTRPFPFWRALALIIGMACLGVYLMLAAAGVAHAGERPTQTQELKAAAERLNSECRDNPRAVGACKGREIVLEQLRRDGQCWNAQAATPSGLWVPCAPVSKRDPDGFTANACDTSAQIAYSLALFRDAGVAPQTAYGRAVGLARDAGLSPAPLQALTWSIYFDLGALQPSAVRHAARYECRRSRGML